MKLNKGVPLSIVLAAGILALIAYGKLKYEMRVVDNTAVLVLPTPSESRRLSLDENLAGMPTVYEEAPEHVMGLPAVYQEAPVHVMGLPANSDLKGLFIGVRYFIRNAEVYGWKLPYELLAPLESTSIELWFGGDHSVVEPGRSWTIEASILVSKFQRANITLPRDLILLLLQLAGKLDHFQELAFPR